MVSCCGRASIDPFRTHFFIAPATNLPSLSSARKARPLLRGLMSAQVIIILACESVEVTTDIRRSSCISTVPSYHTQISAPQRRRSGWSVPVERIKQVWCLVQGRPHNAREPFDAVKAWNPYIFHTLLSERLSSSNDPSCLEFSRVRHHDLDWISPGHVFRPACLCQHLSGAEYGQRRTVECQLAAEVFSTCRDQDHCQKQFHLL